MVSSIKVISINTANAIVMSVNQPKYSLISVMSTMSSDTNGPSGTEMTQWPPSESQPKKSLRS